MSETIEQDGYVIRIEQDEDTGNPIEDRDFLWKFLIYHNRYDFGHDKTALGFPTVDSVLEHIRLYPWALMLPLYLFDHSGTSISLDPERFRAWDSHGKYGWDWGPCGWLWASHASVLKEYGVKRMRPSIRKRALKLAEHEVSHVNDWMTGNVWMYSIRTVEGSVIESCGGYIGDIELCREEALSVLPFCIEQDKLNISQRRKEELGRLSPVLHGFSDIYKETVCLSS